MSVPRYPKYKDSGVEWLRQIPEHWEVLAIKRAFDVFGGATPASDNPDYWDGDIMWATPADLGKSNSMWLSDTQRKITKIGMESCATNLVPRGAVILSTRAPVGSVGIAAVPTTTNQGCKTLVAKEKANGVYMAYLLLSCAKALEVQAKGTTFLELSGDELARFKIPLPTASEQRAIVDYLDRETAKIDALVAEQGKLIALLKEKRQAAISRAITKGLNPDTPMRDSGIEWLGPVPAHWQLQRGRWLFKLLADPPEPSDGVVTAFRDGQVTLRELRRTEGFTLAVLEVGYQHVRKGDLVIHGMDAFAGAIGVAEQTGKCSPEYQVLTPLQPGIETTYFARVLRMMALRNWVYVICPSVRERAPRFRFEAFKDVLLPVPPHEEQKAILAYIEQYRSKADPLIAEAERAIALLKERRAAIISAAVTGQIDVRASGGKTA